MKDNQWIEVGEINQFFANMGSCVKIEDKQIAIFNNQQKQWYAVDNLCPHKKQMVLSRGIMGSQDDEPKVACPLHKRNFSLKSGRCISDDSCSKIATYPIKVESNKVFIAINE